MMLDILLLEGRYLDNLGGCTNFSNTMVQKEHNSYYFI